MLSIRQANADDVSLLSSLIHEFAEFERLPVSTRQEDLLRDGFGDRPKFRAIIIEWGGAPAGYAMFFECYSSFEGSAALYLEDIYVRQEYRGNGAGKAVLSWLAGVAIAEGLCGVRWQVLDWNTPAIEFYRKLGAEIVEGRKVFSLHGEAMARVAGDGA